MLLSAQPPFGAATTPPAGFPAHYSGPNYDRNWFNAATIITRYNICSKVLYKGIFEFDVIEFVKNTVSDPSDPELMLTELTDIIFPETASAERKQYFIDTFLFDGGSLLQEGPDAYFYWKTLWSEYLGGNKVNTVKTILKSLLEALLWSQEYQTT